MTDKASSERAQTNEEVTSARLYTDTCVKKHFVFNVAEGQASLTAGVETLQELKQLKDEVDAILTERCLRFFDKTMPLLKELYRAKPSGLSKADLVRKSLAMDTSDIGIHPRANVYCPDMPDGLDDAGAVEYAKTSVKKGYVWVPYLADVASPVGFDVEAATTKETEVDPVPNNMDRVIELAYRSAIGQLISLIDASGYMSIEKGSNGCLLDETSMQAKVGLDFGLRLFVILRLLVPYTRAAEVYRLK